MLGELARRVGVGIAGAILIGTGASATLVALAFAIYAALKPYVGPASASGLTALAAALLTGLSGVLLLRTLKAPRPTARVHQERLPRGVLAELGVLVLGILGDLAAGRRVKREQKARDAKHRRR